MSDETTTGAEAPEQETPVAAAESQETTEQQTAEPETDEAAGGDESEPPKPRKPGKTERELRRLQRTVAEMAQTIQSLSGGGHEAGKPRETEPRPDQYEGEYDPKYILARAKWELRQEQEAESAKASQRTMRERVTAMQDRGAEEFEDFAEVFDVSVAVSPAMAEAMLESDIGHKIAYHLGQHPDEAARIAKLSPFAAAKEIGRLEARLSAPPPPRKTTAVPPPPPSVTGRAAASPRDPAKMTMDEYVRWRAEGNG